MYTAAELDAAVAVFEGALGADLLLAKSASPSVAPTSQSLTYTMTVTNNGPLSASTLTVNDTLPSTVSFVSASAECGESSRTVTCTTA